MKLKALCCDEKELRSCKKSEANKGVLQRDQLENYRIDYLSDKIVDFYTVTLASLEKGIRKAMFVRIKALRAN